MQDEACSWCEQTASDSNLQGCKAVGFFFSVDKVGFECSHAKAQSVVEYTVMVCRLDGPEEKIVLGLIDKALEGKDLEDVSAYMDPKTEQYRKMVEWIRNDIEVTTLRYQNLEDMIKAIGLPKEKLCLYCWTGQCPGCAK